VTQITGGLNDTTNASYAQANTARTTANDAYGQANTARDQANTARTQANTAYGQANTARDVANASYGQANSAGDQANTARTTANDAYGTANTKLSTSGGSISGDLTISGNLVVQGNATTINVSSLSVNDSIILLSANSSGDAEDIGFIGHYANGATNTHAGFFRKATENQFYVFDNYEIELTNNVIDIANNNFRVGNVRLGILNANSVLLLGNSVSTQANLTLAHNQANSARDQANTARDTGNNAYGQANSARDQANTARDTANGAYGQANTARTTANDAYGQANAAYGAANNRVLKAGDTMTGQLNISSGGLLVTGNVGFGTTSPNNIFHVVKNSLANVNYNNQGAILFEGSELQMQLISDDGGSHATKLTLSTVVQANGTNKHWMLDHKGPSLGNRFDISYYTSNSSGNILAPSGVELLTILTDGKVGIGTTNPSAKMHVYTSGGGMEFAPGANGYIEFIDRANTSASVNTAFYTRQGFFAFHTGAYSERLRIINNGNVGIGTTAPIGKQHNYISSRSTAFSASDGATWHDLIIQNPNNTLNAAVGLAFELNGTYHENAGTGIAAVKSTESSDYGADMVFVTRPQNAVAAERMRITSAGNVGIGTTSTGSYKLNVQGDQYISGTLTEASSVTLKENINPILNALDLITNLTGVTYDRKDGSAVNRAGLIAEEVEQVLPNIIQKDKEGNPSGIQYTNLIAYLVESIKELKTEIDSLKKNNGKS
jgi:hypothetical protein